jgi:tetratricopeptide (TPR) repeat protein
MLHLEKGAQLCGRFTLVERLGTGGQGEVWRAIDDARAGAEVALKILHPEVARSPAAWETLRHEHTVAQRLGHPGIAEAGEPVRDDEATVLPMSLATGDLRRLRGEPYTRIVPALIQVAAAMEYAHSRGVVHRDLKPGNVLIDPEGKIIVADFGVAALDGVLPVNTIGSPFSASPQQIEGEPPAPADDIYGLGSLAYELLSGYPPYYPNFEPRAVIGQPVPELLPIHVAPPRLLRLVMRMLAKDPAERPASMRDVQEELQATLHDTVGTEDSADGTAARDGDDAAGTTTVAAAARAAAQLQAADGRDLQALDDASATRPVRDFADRPGDSTGVVDVVVGDEAGGGAAADADAVGGAGRPSRVAAFLKWAGLAAVAAAVLAVFVLLPRIAEQRDGAARTAPAAPAGAAGDVAPTRPGAPAALTPRAQAERAQADRAAATAAREASKAAAKAFEDGRKAYDDALTALEARAAGVWGGAAFASAKSLGADAVAAMTAGNTDIALDRIKVAKQRLDRLAEQAPQAVAAQLAAGDRALAAGQTEIARQAFDLALRIDPSSAAAQRGLQRSGGLASVLPVLTEAENALAANDHARAIQLFEQVLRADPQNAAAKDGIARAGAAAGSDAFARAIGDALAALRSGRLDEARVALERARAIRPQAPEVASGFQQLAARSTGRDLTGIQARAADLERQERWGEALAEYEALLRQDAGVAFARAGRARVAPRAELASRLQGLIDKPDRLAAAEVRAEADQLLVRARGIADAGPVLRSQVARLEALLPAYDKPVRVSFESDGQTQVAIQRVRVLGAFEKQEVELKPGRYTAVGTRAGFRDVRREFTVLPGGGQLVVPVRCAEPIQ